MRGSSQAAPMSAPERPSFANTKPKRARSEATRKSAASASTAPAPTAAPPTAATMGFSSSRIASTVSPARRVNARISSAFISASAATILCRSPPEQKPWPAPVSTTARTRALLREAAERVAQRAVALEGQRVQRLGPVERHRRDAVAAALDEQLARHGSTASACRSRRARPRATRPRTSTSVIAG